MRGREKVLVTSAPPGAGAWNRSGVCKAPGRIKKEKRLRKYKYHGIQTGKHRHHM